MMADDFGRWQMGIESGGLSQHNGNTETEPIPDGTGRRLSEEHEQRFAVVVHHPGGAEMRLLRPEVPLVIGRTEPSDLRISDRRLSRTHARFVLSAGRILVEDLGSTNGTWLAGQRIEKTSLELGDEILVGGLTARVHFLGWTGTLLGLDGEDGFRCALEEELARARKSHRPFALLVVRAAPPPTRGGRPGPEQYLAQWIERVHRELRRMARLSPHGDCAVQVLLPDTSPDEAMRIARALASGKPTTGTALVVGVGIHPGPASTVDSLIEQTRAAANRASTTTQPVEVAAMASGSPSGAGDDEAPISGQQMRELLKTARQVSDSRVPVILQGETGTGKEVLARFLHDHGPRKQRPMVRINCGAIPKELVESTLFGHERGAFTGAVQPRKGIFEEADGGTVFLDEIGEMPLGAQAALLRVLETGSFSRVGASRELSVDVRIVAATHRDLEGMADEGGFRADLFYRLNAITLHIPPLRERTDEIEPLALRFLRWANVANRRAVQGIAPEAMELLKRYVWPGNIRELKNAIERAVVISRGEWLGPEDLPGRIRTTGRAVEPPAVAPGPLRVVPPESSGPSENQRRQEARRQVRDYESKLLQEALESAGWNREVAAGQLGLPVRTLSYRMKVLGVKKPAS